MKSKTHRPSPDSSVVRFEEEFVRPKPGRTLIVGSQITTDKEDRRLRYPDVLGVDMQMAVGVDRELDLEEPLPDDIGTFDHIECMSVLEHSKRPWLLAANLERLLKSGGTIYVVVPWIWRYHGYPNDYYRLSPDAIRYLFPTVKWERIMFASDALSADVKTKALKEDGHPFLSRTETVAFGRK